MLKLITWLDSIKERFKPLMIEKKIIKEPGIKEDQNELDEEIQKAHKQWQQARKYFNNVSDPGLIDHASYKIQAARAKYMYLLNKMKNNKQINKGGN